MFWSKILINLTKSSFKSNYRQILVRKTHKFRGIRNYYNGMTRLKDNEINFNSINESYDNIIKSIGDKRDYKAFILDNGLKVLLVSDPETDKSAAALDVNVGFMCDPREVQGLAHFLEHMLFLGTKKCPEENDYSKYLSRNGGASNAFTSSTHTNFYFDVSPNSLTGALDRFAQFFIEPLLTESAADREINAVNSEHERNIDDDGWRLSQLEKTLSDPKHDFSKFGTGNVETLKERPIKDGIDVRQALLDFHNKWYSANIMSLVVLGKETLGELMEVVIPLFSEIKNKSVTPPEWPSHPFTNDYLRKEASIVPIRDSRSLGLTFPIPDLVPYYKSQPGHYIAHLIGHEGPGSLLSELKSQGLCTVLNAYDRRGAKGFGFFNVSVDLTPEGIERTDDIIALIFQYINLLKKEGPKQWIYDEERRLKQIKFQFKDKERPINYVRDLASVLHDFPLNESLSAGYLLEEFRPDLITEVLDLMTPKRIRVAIVGKKFNGMTDSTEKWYGTLYKVEDIPQHKIDLWTNCGLNEEKLFLPPVNDFIPSNLNLTKREVISEKSPQMIKNSEFSRIWYLQDDQYLKPKVYYGFELTNPLAYADPFHANATYLFTRLFRDSINEYSYAAELAGLFYSFSSTSSGLILEMGGYNDKLNVLLTKILQKMIDYKIDSKRFEVIKEIYIRGLKNYPTRPLHELLRYYTSLVTSEQHWSYEELLETAPEVTVDNLQQFIPQLLSRFHIEALIHGNIERSEALKVCDLVENQFKSSALQTRPISLSQHFRNREIQLVDGSEYAFETINAVHQKKAIQIYLQIGVQETLSNASLELVNQLLNEPFFNELRTKEQLGYLTFSSLRRANGVQGMIFIIQSDYSPQYLNQRIEAFINWSEQYIRDMKDEEFEAEKQSLITHKLEKPKQLMAFSKRLWGEIECKQYNFNRDLIEVNAIKQLTKEDIIAFFKRYLAIDSPNRKKLAVSILSTNPSTKSETVENKDGLLPTPQLKESVKIENIGHFKNSSALYQLPEPFIDVYKIENSKL